MTSLLALPSPWWGHDFETLFSVLALWPTSQKGQLWNLYCFPWFQPEPALEQTVKLPTICKPSLSCDDFDRLTIDVFCRTLRWIWWQSMYQAKSLALYSESLGAFMTIIGSIIWYRSNAKRNFGIYSRKLMTLRYQPRSSVSSRGHSGVECVHNIYTWRTVM